MSKIKKAGGGYLSRMIRGRSGAARRELEGKSADRVRGKSAAEGNVYDGPADEWLQGMSKEEIDEALGRPKYDPETGVRRHFKRGGKTEVGKVDGKKSAKRLDKRRR